MGTPTDLDAFDIEPVREKNINQHHNCQYAKSNQINQMPRTHFVIKLMPFINNNTADQVSKKWL